MIPTSLYIHIPWCVRKCPYCDFNSHKRPDTLPEEQYIQALLEDFSNDLRQYQPQEIHTIFIGGGTPSLMSGESYAELLHRLQQLVAFSPDIEITMEANPGTMEQQRFKEYRQAGINRLSLGIQSFNAGHLKALGRIHDDLQAHRAIEMARWAGFDNINLDIMHGLPGQSVQGGIDDLQTALAHHPEHLSWYQLTLEPNTVFYRQRPSLPSEDITCDMEEKGFALLAKHGYERYEISAFCQPGRAARHNLNYWLFGDYFGIGAGAHGKLSPDKDTVFRTRKHRQPQKYLAPEQPFLIEREKIGQGSLAFEFMLNTTRLEQVIPYTLFPARTGLPLQVIQARLEQAAATGLISLREKGWQITELGRRYTNDLQTLFLPE
ncbi:radical SAM family heme chaperone HemW [Legionella spiritensis]|uniref:Heme chaperone HemW n=1 Tax=Legionella spiritensis TaxID=452 RepID=A0A0W0Z9Y8_LEGSP|nr:radical SAM family heme chaperone HemW [Legionella spiritensis]KTD65924.1 oxygen-independent coproporphyrinogen III oxidase [Legionella spiritensis]SNV31803.1 oxygen-independent coproporphyrinogen III oxidase [Legionella spiritensis]VEG92173.1 oxygen-independent coproporphyrinogen III oxidase [Legionella spiritensis]